MITLRLEAKLEQKVKNTAQTLGITKSELIRQSISNFLASLDKPSPWQLGEDLFGKFASGCENLSRDRKALLITKIKQKNQ